jgi:hypothetical protein
MFQGLYITKFPVDKNKVILEFNAIKDLESIVKTKKRLINLEKL